MDRLVIGFTTHKSKDYYCPPSIPIVSYSNTLQSTDLNDVLIVCGGWLLRIEMNAQILGVDATQILLVNLLTKRRLPNIALASKELSKLFHFIHPLSSENHSIPP
jgi:hypothetical protein